LPKLAFTGFASRYREPTLAEGFAEIIMTDFEVCTIQAGHLAMHFWAPKNTLLTEMQSKFQGSEEQKKLWGRYWV
jgi:bifunctional polynucleotide phosphatase/kinase